MFRDPVNGFLHLGALLVSIVGVSTLMLHCQGDPRRLIGAGIYGLGMIGCFLGSSLHHLVRGPRALEMRLLKLDHAAIYPFIAGTYTPVCLNILPAPGGLALLAAVWLFAAVGMIYKLWIAKDQQDVNDPPGQVDTMLYVAMGWLVVTQLGPLRLHSTPGSLALAMAGGVAYSLGGVILSRRWFDFRPGRFGHHEIWHLAVIVGAACFFAYVWLNLS